jgi:hypothetical protein
LDRERRVLGIVPGLDVGAIDGSPGYAPALRRFRRWVDARIAVRGRPEWVFVKIHTHGAPERNAATLLGHRMAALHEAINREFNDGHRYRLHYVTARELFNIVRAAEAGETGSPATSRPYSRRRSQRGPCSAPPSDPCRTSATRSANSPIADVQACSRHERGLAPRDHSSTIVRYAHTPAFTKFKEDPQQLGTWADTLV